MPPSPNRARDITLAAFMTAFSEEKFFEAHEILEAFWVDYRGDDRDFHRGLIQAAVALHHLSAGNTLGAMGVAARAKRNLAPYAPRHDEVDVDAILARLAAT